MKRLSAALLVIVMSIMSTACSKDEVTATLGGLVNAAVAAADIAQPQDATLLNGITAQCIDPAINELASSDTGARKSIAILGACTPEVALLGNSTGLQAVAAALSAFLDSVKGLTAEATQTPAGANAFFGSTSAAKIDKAKLAKIRKQVTVLKAKLAKRK